MSMHKALEVVVRSIPNPAIAVSGGVDSVTLAAVVTEIWEDVLIVHATSPAVPREATERLSRLALSRGWLLVIITAGEFDDANYLANPVNRCLYCKTSLYKTIRLKTDRTILSGANLDDLGEYRPGLDAARAFGVRHPYIESQITKRSLREISRELGLTEFADLPSSPCLSSRVETGIRIEAPMLRFIHEAEKMIQTLTGATTVRCRVRAHEIVIELDTETLSVLDESLVKSMITAIDAMRNRPRGLPIGIEAYRNGSAFIGQESIHAR